ncbi:MAG: hypothetical protein FJY83_03785 [Candidatus Aminicenantes bacterium]|nr:hypothetical protein [Candidatus Aminicenantes bacterium]
MSYITIEIRDLFGNKSDRVEVPDDVAVNRLLVVLVERLNYPRFDATGGQLLSYRLHHIGTQKQLLDELTLAASGVRDGDALRLVPEITAG